MLGQKIELIRYKISYIENEKEMQENCISKEHKNELEQILTDRGIEFTATPVDQTENEWFNGLEFDSYDEALEVFKNGESAYNKSITTKQITSNEQLRADTDYLAIMAGVDLSV